MKRVVPWIVILGGFAAPAHAACPPPAPGDTAAEIRGNSERLICLQTNLATQTAQRQLQMRLEAINNRLRDIELQQRLDDLPPPPVVVARPPTIP